MASSFPLFSQPASFWIGAFLLAEVPVGAVAWFLAPATKERIFSWVFSSPLGIFAVFGTALILGLIVGWLGHKLGLGQ